MPWKRGPFRGRSLHRALNIADLREMARRRIPGFVFEYAEGGAEDEVSLRGNLEALARLRFVPPTLIDTSARHQRTSILGLPASSPLVIAPTGLNGLLRRDGDVALARAAAQAGIPYTLSTVSTTRLEEVARRAGGRLWMQLYVVRERDRARSHHAARRRGRLRGAGVHHRCQRLRQPRVGPARLPGPGKPTLRAILDTLRHPRWMLEVLAKAHAALPQPRGLPAAGGGHADGRQHHDPAPVRSTLRWDDLAWIREHWHGKLIIKGVLTVADAERAAALGCDGIVLSNHGGRQLDSCVSGMDVLPEVVAAVGRGSRCSWMAASAVAPTCSRPWPRRPGGADRPRAALRPDRRRRGRRGARTRDAHHRDRPRPRPARLQLGRRAQPRPGAAPLSAAPQRSGDLSSSARYCFHSTA